MTELNLYAKTQELEAGLRPVGLYVDSVQWHSPTPEAPNAPGEGDTLDPEEKALREQISNRHVCVMECMVGAVAFSRRVQDSEQLGFDEEFALMRHDLEEQDFESKRAEMLQRIADGKDPLGDD